jgi:SRSO17 transposase
MTDQEIAAVGPAFARYLAHFRAAFLQRRTATHFDHYCRGLLSDLPRKSVEPIALACGTAVRTLQEFLVTARWDEVATRDRLQRRLAGVLADLPADRLGTVGVIDETSCVKKGDRTPGVQRQYLGCAGKVENGIVTVHVGVAKGRFRALLDAELYVPAAWAADRDRCAEAGIPAAVGYRAKWRIALDQLVRLGANGHRFDWLTFDEGYGSRVPFLTVLSIIGQRFVAEVPVNLAVRTRGRRGSRRAAAVLPPAAARRGRRIRLARETLNDQVWRAADRSVGVAGRPYRLIVAINEATAEVKYFLTNATTAPLGGVLAAAFCRWSVEHAFRVAKQEAGLVHYEGRDYRGLNRHLILALLVMGFVAAHTDRLRGEKPARDDGAGLPGTERPLRDALPPPPRAARAAAHRPGHPLPPAPQRPSHPFPQETAA